MGAIAFLVLVCLKRGAKEDEAPKDTPLEIIALNTMAPEGQLPSPPARTDNLRRVFSTEQIVPIKPTSNVYVPEDDAGSANTCLGCGNDGKGRVDPNDDKFYCNVCWTTFADKSNLPGVVEESAAAGKEDPLPPSPTIGEESDDLASGNTAAATEETGNRTKGVEVERHALSIAEGEEGPVTPDDAAGEEASATHAGAYNFDGLPTGDLDQQTEVAINVNVPVPVRVPAAANFELLMSVQSDVTAGKDTSGDTSAADSTTLNLGGGYLTLHGSADTDSGSDEDDVAKQQDGLDDVDTAARFDVRSAADADGSAAGGGYLGIEAASDGSGSDEEPLPGETRNRNSHLVSMASTLGLGSSGKVRPESTFSANFDAEGLTAVKTPGSTMAGGITLGARVSVEGYECQGTVRFIGPHHEPTKGARVLVELDLPVGKNDGTVSGHVYGAVAAKCGVLVAPSKVYKGMPGRRITKRQKPKKRSSTKRRKPGKKSSGGDCDDDYDEDPLGLGDADFDEVAATLVQAPARSRVSHLLSMSRHLKGGSILETEMDVDNDDIDLDNIDLESPTREQYNGFASVSPDFAAEGEYGFGGEINFVDGVSGAGPVEEEFGFETDGDPRLHPWYVDDMNHDDCSKLVLASSTGDFLVRSSEGKHVLCINDHQRLKVVDINKTGRGSECELNGKRFADLGVVLDSLQRDPLLSVRGMPLNLASPASNSA